MTSGTVGRMMWQLLRRVIRWRECRLGIFLLACPGLALANAGLPMLAVVWPLSLPALIPVVLLESYVIGHLSVLGGRKLLASVFRANLLSTAVGLPLGWLALVALEFILASGVVSSGLSKSYPPRELAEVLRVMLMAPWLGPVSEGSEWIIPVATMTLLVPFCLVSYWFEASYLMRYSPVLGIAVGRRAVWRANFLSYAMLFVACLGWLLLGQLR